MDHRLARHIDGDGNEWVICQSCTEWTACEDLAIDPTDGLRWDICKECNEEGQGWRRKSGW